MNKFIKIIIDGLLTVIFSWLFYRFFLCGLALIVEFIPEANPSLSDLVALVVVSLLVRAVIRSKAGTAIKAASLVALFGAFSAAIGTYFGGQMEIIYSLNAAVALSIIYCLYRTKASWQYYLAAVFFYSFLAFLLITGWEM